MAKCAWEPGTEAEGARASSPALRVGNVAACDLPCAIRSSKAGEDARAPVQGEEPGVENVWASAACATKGEEFVVGRPAVGGELGWAFAHGGDSATIGRGRQPFFRWVRNQWCIPKLAVACVALRPAWRFLNVRGVCRTMPVR